MGNNGHELGKYELGVIGVGNMGAALARAASRTTESIILSNRTKSKAEALAGELSVAVGDNTAVARSSSMIMLGVKPSLISGVISEIAPILSERACRGEKFCLVSMAAGVTISDIESMLPSKTPIIRIMPNTPVSIGQGVILRACNESGTEHIADFDRLFEQSGKTVDLDEKLFDAGGAISGCAPAFVDIFMDALAEGGVRSGLPRVLAEELAKQTVLGSAALALESNMHLCALRDAVCSPGGSTIEGVSVLERSAFRAAVSDAVAASKKRSSELFKK